MFKDADYSPLKTPQGLSIASEAHASTSDVVTTPSRRLLLNNDTPRTPTPFKKALADLEKKSGPISTLPDTPTRLEDITEIMKKDQDTSNYETDASIATVSDFFMPVSIFLNKKLVLVKVFPNVACCGLI